MHGSYGFTSDPQQLSPERSSDYGYLLRVGFEELGEDCEARHLACHQDI
jgi:hypothetical protein